MKLTARLLLASILTAENQSSACFTAGCVSALIDFRTSPGTLILSYFLSVSLAQSLSLSLSCFLLSMSNKNLTCKLKLKHLQLALMSFNKEQIPFCCTRCEQVCCRWRKIPSCQQFNTCIYIILTLLYCYILLALMLLMHFVTVIYSWLILSRFLFFLSMFY